MSYFETAEFTRLMIMVTIVLLLGIGGVAINLRFHRDSKNKGLPVQSTPMWA